MKFLNICIFFLLFGSLSCGQSGTINSTSSSNGVPADGAALEDGGEASEMEAVQLPEAGEDNCRAEEHKYIEVDGEDPSLALDQFSVDSNADEPVYIQLTEANVDSPEDNAENERSEPTYLEVTDQTDEDGSRSASTGFQLTGGGGANETAAHDYIELSDESVPDVFSLTSPCF